MTSLLAQLAYALLPSVPLDTSVANANTGHLLLDALPLVTMLPCLRTLALFSARRRRRDFAAFGLGFALAVAYHIW